MRNILGAWSRSPRPSKLPLAVTVNTLLYPDPFAGMGGGGEGRDVSGGEKPSDFAVLTRLSKVPIGSGLTSSNRFGPPSVK